ncbi:MAG: secretion system protein F [Chloroflexi bacterium]|nr:secretion system protein F [Chloroflexota bacterium]
MTGVVALLVGLAVFALVRGIYLLLRESATVVVDLEPFIPTKQGTKKEGASKRLRPWLHRLEQLALSQRLNDQLDRARVNMTGGEWLALWGGLTVGGFVVGWLLSRSLMAAVGLALLGLLIPPRWLASRIQKRHQEFQDQLTDVLRLITNALQAGHGLLQAIQVVAEEMPPPAGEEFSRVLQEMSLGYPLVQALRRLAERVESDDMDMVVTAIEIHSEVGGTLSEILSTVSNTIEERVRLQGELRTLTAQQRISGYVISAMPFVLAVILSLLNPEYMRGLFTPGWIWLPALGLFMILLGNAIIQRMMRIDV